jgi:cephalosporin hydroxylase
MPPEHESFQDVLAKHSDPHDNTVGTDKATLHSYGPLYSELFGPIRDTTLHVLEIGVCSGKSLLAMAEFFHNAQVVGVDISMDNVCQEVKEHPRISLYQLDGTRRDIQALIGPATRWDVVLDDASHVPADQLLSLQALGPFVRRPGGLYVIEDIHLLTLQEQLRAAAQRMNFTEFQWHDLRHIKGRFDDIVAVMRA